MRFRLQISGAWRGGGDAGSTVAQWRIVVYAVIPSRTEVLQIQWFSICSVSLAGRTAVGFTRTVVFKACRIAA
jgi:hypothetical protein